MNSVSTFGHFFDQKMMKILKWEVANFKMLVLGAQKELGAQILAAVRYFSKFQNLMWILRNLMWILSHFDTKHQIACSRRLEGVEHTDWIL